VSCLSRQQDASRKNKSFLPTMGIPSGFLMGVSVICVLSRRHDASSCGQGRVCVCFIMQDLLQSCARGGRRRVRTDQVQRDICTAQYKLFNFSVNTFISGPPMRSLAGVSTAV